MAKKNKSEKVKKGEGLQIAKVETALSKLNQSEKMFVYAYCEGDFEHSPLHSVIKCGFTNDLSEASVIATALLNNKNIANAIEEFKKLRGMSLGAIKDRLWEIAMQNDDLKASIKALQEITRMQGHEKPKQVVKTIVVDEKERFEANRARISSGISEVISEIEGEIINEIS